MSGRKGRSPRRHGRRPASSLDVRVLQTAASLENLAVAAYRTAERLEFGRHGYPALGSFVAASKQQHVANAAAFNAAAVRAGGAAQHAEDPRYSTTVRQDMLHLTEAEPVVSLLASLEDVNAQSYTRYAGLASSPAVRRLFVSAAIAAAEHRSFLLAAQLLLNTGPADLLRVPTIPGELPALIGTKCVPLAFYPTAAASGIDEGAVR